MTILMFLNLKGGVAKTTNAVAVAECFAAEQDKRVLVIDADHQCAASEMLLGETRYLHCDEKKSTLHDMLATMLNDEFRGEQVEGYIQANTSDIDGGLENLSVLPCSVRIDDFQTNMAKARRGFRSTEEFYGTLRKRRGAVKTWLNNNYDYTIIDCPPSVALQVRFLLNVATGYIIPCVPDRLSVRGSAWLAGRIRSSGFKTHGIGTLWSLYRKQNVVHTQTIENASSGRGPFNELPKPFETIIPNATAIATANEEAGKPHIFRSKKRGTFKAKYGGKAAAAFRNLCQEIGERCNGLEEANVKSAGRERRESRRDASTRNDQGRRRPSEVTTSHD